jgi:hypothetical protein
MSKLNSYIDEAVENIRKDRKVTKALLDDLIQYMAKEESRHRDVGLTAAKYLETLQRSNEQLVKVSGIVAKKTSNVGLTSEDKEEIYNLLNESQSEDDE